MHDHNYQLHQTNSSHSGDNFQVKGKLQSYHQPPQTYLNFELLYRYCPRSYMHLKFELQQNFLDNASLGYNSAPLLLYHDFPTD